VHSSTLTGRAPLHNACARTDARMVQLLLDAGAASDVNRQCNEGMRPIDYAVQWSRRDVIELLERAHEASREQGGASVGVGGAHGS
jgi:ankyrin repeat protein